MKKVRLDCPASWRVEPRGEARLFHAKSPAKKPQLTVTLSGLEALPDDPVAFLRGQLVEPGAHVEILSAAEITLRSGWPALLFEARAKTATSDDKRLLLLARFLEWGALASWRAAIADYDLARAQVLELLDELTIDWGGQPLLSLAQVWDGLD